MRRLLMVQLIVVLLLLVGCQSPAAPEVPTPVATTPAVSTPEVPTPEAPAPETPAPEVPVDEPALDEGRVVYLERDMDLQRDELWSVSLAGDEAELLAACEEPCSIENVATSPDGRQVAYTTQRAGEPSVLHLISAGGDRMQEIATDVAEISRQPFSPDGTRVAFLRWREAGTAPVPEASIWVVDLDGGEPAQVGDWGFFLAAPAWVDDQQLVFSQAADGTPPTRWSTYLLGTEGAAEPELLSTGRFIELAPDRAQMLAAFEVGGQSEDRFELGLISVEEGEIGRIAPEEGPDLTARWSPDGGSVTRYVWAAREIRLLNLEDGSEEVLSTIGEDGFFLVNLAWSPTGRSLAYVIRGTGMELSEVRQISIEDGSEQLLATFEFDPRALVVVSP